MRHIVVGVHITDRTRHVPEVQKVFTEYGCFIRTRLGLHEVDAQSCSPNGLILLELLDDEPVMHRLREQLEAIEGVEVQTMVFDH